ncbi:GTPase Era [Halobacteriovorax sp. HLS]|uniref:GTPase Era n=1 Tax=Halobacteriovorax sp. HLS TaxID=2234000 RepID=UPI000FDB7A9E|nr:GTPase Era [Halobacteriovorax sp. HLS]
MLIEHQHPDNKSIMVAVLGAPNVGKSSLINYLLGVDLSVVTSKAQTTRNKFHCVFAVDRTEIVLVDTPGLHKTNQELNKRLNDQARSGLEGADLNLLLIDLTRPVIGQLQDFIENMETENFQKTWIIFTKCDRVENYKELPLSMALDKMMEIMPAIERAIVVSTKDGTNMHNLTGSLVDAAIPGPHYYDDGSVSNKNERFFATEYIREQAFELLNDELPYEIAVVVDEYKDMRPKKGEPMDKEKIKSHISASILVNRPSQRAIVVGTKGGMIKEIGTRSRKKIEAMVGGQVHLNLHVKVSPKWFKNNFVLEEIGLPRAKDSNRVWRSK